MPAGARGTYACRIPDALDQHVDAVAAPEQLAVEDHGRHAEHAERLGLSDDLVMLRARGTGDISFEIRRRAAERHDHACYGREIVDLQIVAPEPPEHRVMVSPEEAVTLREQHADARIEGIVN